MTLFAASYVRISIGKTVPCARFYLENTRNTKKNNMLTQGGRNRSDLRL